jgi:outer membrane protein assembly factor BamB
MWLIGGFPSDRYLLECLVMKPIRIVVLILCASFASVAWGKEPASKCSNNWTEFHRVNMQRWNPCEKVLGVNNVGSLSLKWSYTTGSYVNSAPTVANGAVYVGSEDYNLYALNARTGAKLWSYAAGAHVDSSPAVANGVVYFGSFYTNDTVYALNASTGAKLWSYSLGGNFIEDSPAVANGVVYFGASDHNLYALNAKTGAKLWNYSTGGDMFSSPAVADGVVYVGSWDFNVYALNASTGAKLWSHSFGRDVNSSPAVAKGVVYVGAGDRSLHALNANTGSELWSHERLLPKACVANLGSPPVNQPSSTRGFP